MNMENLNPTQQTILETIKAQREKLQQRVDAAVAERDSFLLSITETLGQQSNNGNRRQGNSNRKPWTDERKAAASVRLKERFKNAKPVVTPAPATAVMATAAAKK
jgi:hypothetical protein